MKHSFTTGEAAKICGVAPRTISKWCDAGQLACYLVPETNHRRIERIALAAFMVERGMPTNTIGIDGKPTMVMLGVPEVERVTIATKMLAQGYSVVGVDTIWELARITAAYAIEAVLVDVSVGRSFVLAVGREFAVDPTLKHAVRSVLVYDDEGADGEFMEAKYHHVMRRPLDTDLFMRNGKAG